MIAECWLYVEQFPVPLFLRDGWLPSPFFLRGNWLREVKNVPVMSQRKCWDPTRSV